MNPFLDVAILSPRENYFKGTALAVSSTNLSGKFDILPEHANFITLIEGKPIIVHLPGGEKLTYAFPLAIIYHTRNRVRIYTDIQIKLTPGKN